MSRQIHISSICSAIFQILARVPSFLEDIKISHLYLSKYLEKIQSCDCRLYSSAICAFWQLFWQLRCQKGNH